MLIIDETNKKELEDALGITKLKSDVKALQDAAAAQASSNSGGGSSST